MSFAVEMSAETLESLAAERPENTNEIFSPNDFYGHATILKQYCGLPADYAIHGVLPHSPCISSLIWEVEKNHPLQARFLLSETQRQVYQQQTNLDLYVIGSPLCYAAKRLSRETEVLREKARGTLVFPAHSTHHITAGFNHSDFINRLKSMEDESNPLTVCLYWRDIQLGRHKEYLDAGFRCTTAGHMFDKDYLYRTLRIILSHRKALTNRIGSAALFAAYFGLPVEFMDQEVKLQADDQSFRRELAPHDLPIVDAFIEAAEPFDSETLSTQQSLAQEAMGHEHLLSPEALTDLFESVEAKQKGQPHFTFPTLEKDLAMPALLDEIQGRLPVYPKNQRGTIGYQGTPLQFFDLQNFYDEAHRIFVEEAYDFKNTNRNPVIVDCGTNLGLLPLYFAEKYPEARIIAFEADPIKARIAEHNFQAVQAENIRLIEKAIWLESGTVPFMCQTDIGKPTVVQAPAVQLSEFIGSQKIDLLRLNLAGAEFHILKAAETALSNVQNLITEVRPLPGQPPHLAEILCLLRERGFQCHILEHDGQQTTDYQPQQQATIFAWRSIQQRNPSRDVAPSHRAELHAAQELFGTIPSQLSLTNPTISVQPC